MSFQPHWGNQPSSTSPQNISEALNQHGIVEKTKHYLCMNALIYPNLYHTYTGNNEEFPKRLMGVGWETFLDKFMRSKFKSCWLVCRWRCGELVQPGDKPAEEVCEVGKVLKSLHGEGQATKEGTNFCGRSWPL